MMSVKSEFYKVWKYELYKVWKVQKACFDKRLTKENLLADVFLLLSQKNR